jgi:hypothetical protein
MGVEILYSFVTFVDSFVHSFMHSESMTITSLLLCYIYNPSNRFHSFVSFVPIF